MSLSDRNCLTAPPTSCLFSRSDVFSSLFEGAKFRTFDSVVIWKGRAFVFFCKMKDVSFLKRNQFNESNNTEKTRLA